MGSTSEGAVLSVLSDELQALETETFEIQDHVDTGAELALIADSCSTSSCSTSSSTCSCTSTASCQ